MSDASSGKLTAGNMKFQWDMAKNRRLLSGNQPPGWLPAETAIEIKGLRGRCDILNGDCAT